MNNKTANRSNYNIVDLDNIVSVKGHILNISNDILIVNIEIYRIVE